MATADQSQRNSSSPVRVVIADIRSVMRNGYARCLESADCAVVVVGAIDGDGLMAAAGELRPDAILAGMAVLASRWSGAITWTNDGPAVPLVAALPDIHDGYLAVAVWAEAVGYVLEDARPTELADALCSAAAGRSGWSDDDRQRAVRWQEEVGQPWRSLTDRQREVFHLLVRGLSNQAIADALTLAPKTVEHHVCRILDKLDMKSRAEAIAWYFEEFPPILRGGGANRR